MFGGRKVAARYYEYLMNKKVHRELCLLSKNAHNRKLAILGRKRPPSKQLHNIKLLSTSKMGDQKKSKLTFKVI